MGNKFVTVAAVQSAVSSDLNANLTKTVRLVEQAIKKGAQIICLQELFRTRYFPQYKNAKKDDFSETIPGESTKLFSPLAKKHKVVIIVPIFEKDKQGKYYNSAVVINTDGKLMPTYRKIHIPQDSLFYEKNYFEDGDEGYKIYKTKYATFAVLICYDQWFPEAARAVKLAGADIIFYPTAIGNISGEKQKEGDWHNAWETVMRGHAIANSLHVVAVNRVGREDKLDFWGQSFICDSFGKIIQKGGASKDEVVISKIDLRSNKTIGKEWGFMRNRRPDTYQSIFLKKMTDKLVKENNFIMPAEWERHRATWLAWPNDDDFFENRIKNIEKIYLKIIFLLHKDELIKLIVLNQKKQDEISNLLKDNNVDLSRIIFYQSEYMDVWIRDYGPTFVRNENKVVSIKWHFNQYGGKFPELSKDDNIFLNLKEQIGLEMRNIEMAMEGGAIEGNGCGTILTTEECLILNRNKEKTKEDTELILKETIGASNIIWLNKGLVNDHTDGHIDEVARFVSPSKILCAYEDDVNDENCERLRENYKILENAVDQNGNKFEIIKLPMPHMYYDDGKKHNSKKAPVSYANFYIGNKTVLVSLFNDENDEKAMSIIKSCFPNRNTVGIDCTDLIYGGGALHCITQQEPEI